MSATRFRTIDVDVSSTGVCTLLLNRPEVHNAFNEVMIEEIEGALQLLKTDDAVQIVCVKGAGTSFCAGADLHWMKRSADYTLAENHRDAKRIANMMYTLYSFPKPTIGMVHGAIFGGGVGIVACLDIVVAERSAVFSLSEVKLGLIPAVIGPYVVNAMGARKAKRYILTGEKFDAAAALSANLVHEVVNRSTLAETESRLLCELLSCGPRAQKMAKQLVVDTLSPAMDGEVQTHTTNLIAEIRAGEEGCEGMAAFFAKRHPEWRNS